MRSGFCMRRARRLSLGLVAVLEEVLLGGGHDGGGVIGVGPVHRDGQPVGPVGTAVDLHEQRL
ncbi:MAG TPA: hypothetical protein P5572_10355, partial [Phycisphaerae bacterium]|nr:hypothetical protein [Phycisphaerae bacterium]